jgi:hypothetical protein
VTVKPESLGILHHLAGKPGEHDAVKADFRELLIAEFDVPRAEVHLETRIEVRRRMTIVSALTRSSTVYTCQKEIPTFS